MTLTALRTALVNAATGVDIAAVYFDFSTILNETNPKTYPFAFWNIDNAEGVRQIRASQERQSITMDVFAAKVYTPDADKIPEWDSLISDLDLYLLALDTAEFVQVVREDVDFEMFPEGFVSVDREIAIKYTITLELHC